MTQQHIPTHADSTTFARIVRETSQDAHLYLHGMLADISAADDALGEAMVRLARSAGRYDSSEDGLEWVLSAARRVAIDRAPATENSPGFARDKTANGLRSSLRSLNFSDREVIVLRELLGWDINRIARFSALDLAEVLERLNTARTRLTT